MTRVMSRSLSLRRARLALLAVLAVGVGALTIPTSTVGAAPAGHPVNLGQWISPPPSLSTSGDYATDVFGDPWDFSNAEDVIPVDEVGGQATRGIWYANGLLNVNTVNGSTIRLLFDWPQVLPWGRDGWEHPIDAGRYTRASFSICSDNDLAMGLRFENAFGQEGLIPLDQWRGCRTYDIDLTNPANYPLAGAKGPWAGPVIRFELLRGGCMCSGQANTNPVSLVQLDWFRLYRADAPSRPPTNVPVPKVLTPNVEGGADYATVETGNPWDFNGMDDVASLNDVTNVRIAGGDLALTSRANDNFVGMRLGPPVNTDRYHRLTLDACYEGGFSLADAPGGGMNGRMAWRAWGIEDWTETQDFVVFPGCHRMTFSMDTNPPGAIHDEATQIVTGWRGMRPHEFRFDMNEDRGLRNMTLREVKLADDAAFAQTYGIRFQDVAGVAGARADIFVTTTEGSFNGTRIARDLVVTPGVNTFTWNGTTDTGAPMANATYWVYVVMRAGNNVGTGVSTGPVRVEKPVPQSPSYFVPLTPSRLLDTRNGQGGNIMPLAGGAFTELDVTGVGGVPEGGVTAVVMNVTVQGPTAAGYLAAWPSGEPQPLVANLNFGPGQTVPNLVTVKVGANGRVNIFNSAGMANVIADVMGYYTTSRPSSGGLFTPLVPSRILDSRTGLGRGGVAAPIPPNGSIDVPVTGLGGVPSSGVSAVALNLVVDSPTAEGYLTTWPTGEVRPLAATHNFVPGLTVGNFVLAKVGANGRISIFNSAGTTHVIADVVGYFSSSGGAFVPVTPRRLVDTRDGTGGPYGAVGPDGAFDAALANGSPVPANATAVVVNVTSANSTSPSFITAWPHGASRPLAATLNPRVGVPVPNQAYLKLGGGRLGIYNSSGSTDVIVDVFGYML
jgi:hypothetical protein